MIEAERNPRDDTRRAAIMDAAYGVFSSYGFRRTSMDDIAKAAGISRPALYQSFGNKNDIFTALLARAMDQSRAAAEECLASHLPLRERLEQLLEILILSHHRMLDKLPHGDEILGLKSEIGMEVFVEWDELNRKIFADALAQEPGLKGVLDLPLAQTISLAISGVKARKLSVKEMEAELETVIAVVMATAGK